MDVTAILTSLSEFGVQLRGVLSVLAALVGLILFAVAGRTLVKGGQRADEGPNLMTVGVSLFVGAALLQIAKSIEDTRTGLLAGAGSEIRTMMSTVVPSVGNSVWALLIATCLVWIATIGAIGVFRGFLLWQKAGSGDSQGGQGGDYFWRGLWHIVGGAICINIGT